MFMANDKMCPILPYKQAPTGGTLGPRQCLGERCAWWAVDRCFVAGVGLASMAMGSVITRLLDGELLIKSVKDKGPVAGYEQDDLGVSHV